ncbi:DUF3390 domain-containing protein, partial [Janibacter hoylei]|uniref:lactate utilisation protein LutB domain-containing protein n=1 Tax=Janibacter hoylei TaxID=364298 RepID=UPI0021A5ECFD
HRDARVPKPEAAAMKATAWAFADARRLALGQRASGLAGRVLSRVSRRDNASGRAVLGWLPSVGRQWTQARDMPVPPRQSFRQWWQGRSR